MAGLGTTRTAGNERTVGDGGSVAKVVTTWPVLLFWTEVAVFEQAEKMIALQT